MMFRPGDAAGGCRRRVIPALIVFVARCLRDVLRLSTCGGGIDRGDPPAAACWRFRVLTVVAAAVVAAVAARCVALGQTHPVGGVAAHCQCVDD